MTQYFTASKADRPAYDVLGSRYTVVLSAEETGGAYSMFEFDVVKGHGPPPHVHEREDESFYVLAGEVDFVIDGSIVKGRTGDVVFGPRGIPHTFKGASDQPARILCLTSPGGFERFFAAVGTLAADKSAPAPGPTQIAIEHLLKVAPEYGLTILAGQPS